jgi:hypothetical protein
MANNYVYDFDGYDLNVYDVSSSSFRLVDDTNSFTTENHASESLIHGGYLYLFGTSRIDVFNLNDPAKPQFERSISTGDMGADQGDHCAGFVDNFYVVNNDTKLGIYELNSGNPSLMWSGIVGGIDFTSRHAVAIGNNQIFVNTGDHIDIYLVDGTGRPYLYKTTSIENSGSVYLFANDNVLYVCRGGAEALPYSDFALYDISNMGDPVLIDAVKDSRCRSTSRPIFTDSAMFLSFMDGETIWVKFNLSEISADTPDDEELVVSNFNWSVSGRYSTCAAMDAATGNLQFQSTNDSITGYSYTGEDWHHDCTVTYIGTVNSNISYLNLNDPLTVSEVEDFCETIIPGMVVTVTEYGTSRFACSFYDTFDGSTEIVTFTK